MINSVVGQRGADHTGRTGEETASQSANAQSVDSSKLRPSAREGPALRSTRPIREMGLHRLWLRRCLRKGRQLRKRGESDDLPASGDGKS